MIVCSYLVRMEPFTQHFLRLQGGHFDLADRMFNSIREAWLSASKHNMADVKELIPEFFYLPEFLCNSNNFDLGMFQKDWYYLSSLPFLVRIFCLKALLKLHEMEFGWLVQHVSVCFITVDQQLAKISCERGNIQN